jgi:hypothetical protein
MFLVDCVLIQTLKFQHKNISYCFSMLSAFQSTIQKIKGKIYIFDFFCLFLNFWRALYDCSIKEHTFQPIKLLSRFYSCSHSGARDLLQLHLGAQRSLSNLRRREQARQELDRAKPKAREDKAVQC